jgi:hypothetical protein
VLDDVLEALHRRFGEGWATDDEANLRFSVDAEHLLRDIEGAHLIGDPEIDDGKVTVRVWVDFPLHDLMSADQLAYEIFGRLSEEVFYAERRFETGGLRYPFVTGSPRHGHVGSLVLAGPHAADFVGRFQHRLLGGLRHQA